MKRTELAQIRKDRGLTQGEAAKRIKVERAQLSRIENGRAVPTLRVLVGMARAYRMTLDAVQRAVEAVCRQRARRAA